MTRLLRAQTPLEIQTRRAHFGAQAEIRTVTTLRSKRAEILASISLYEMRLAQARADLAHVTACIAIFEASGDGEELDKRSSRLSITDEPLSLSGRRRAFSGAGLGLERPG
jgi:hypothetical protein